MTLSPILQKRWYQLCRCSNIFHENNNIIDDNAIILANVEKEVLPLMTSLEQHYSLFHNNNFRNNDDSIDDISNIEVDSVYVELYNSPVDDKGVGHFIIHIDDEDEHQYNISINNRDSQLIPLIARSRRRIAVDLFVSFAPILPSNFVFPNLVTSYNSDDISVGKLFAEKNKLILELHKVTLRDKFDFKIIQYTLLHFKAHYSSKSCKWRIRAMKGLNEIPKYVLPELFQLPFC